MTSTVTNVTTIGNLKNQEMYQRAGFSDMLMRIERKTAWYENMSDALVLTTLASVTNAAQAVKATAGKVYDVVIISPAAAVLGVWVQVYNTAFGGVVVGTTGERMDLFCPPGETVAYEIDAAGSANLFGTAISVAATTAAHGATAPAAGDLPTVLVVSK